MGPVANFLLYSFVVVVIAQTELQLEPDIPFLRVRVNGKADLKCCFNPNGMSLNSTWVKRVSANFSQQLKILNDSERVPTSGNFCSHLNLKSLEINDTGLYQCRLEGRGMSMFTHGTFLQVYEPLKKTINLSENTKNNILKAEGVILLLCVLLPSATLLFKSKKLNELEKKKVAKEEENIYQGLNLDDCCTTYDQIERSQTHGPYQDVCNIIEEEEEIQLEKP